MLKGHSVKNPTFSNLVLCFVAACFFLFPAVAPAQETDASKMADTPLRITSDKMIAQQDNSMVEFIGNVRAVRETEEILAQSIKIFMYASGEETDPGEAPGATYGNVKKIVAETDVKYTSGDRKAFADKAVYTTADQVLVLTGNQAKLMTGTSWVTGSKITLFRKEDRAMVESNKKNRVEAFFNPQDKQDKPAE